MRYMTFYSGDNDYYSVHFDEKLSSREHMHAKINKAYYDVGHN